MPTFKEEELGKQVERKQEEEEGDRRRERQRRNGLF